jgi:GH25 family lysozyme M1 (1,4-beta-N-acetylmuramidase)
MDAEEAKITNSAIKAFAQELRAQTKAKTGCYVANHRYNAYNYDSIKSLFDFTWIPSYGSNNGTIEGSKKPSHSCDLWQYTSTAKISGINGNVDMNIITGEGHDLKWFLTR